MPSRAASTLVIAVLAGCTGGEMSRGGSSSPASAVVPPAPAAGPSERTFEQPHAASSTDPLCDPGETETCVCPDESTGSRRCDSRGTAFGPCDACPEPQTCGAQTCEGFRIGLAAITLPGCCPTTSSDRCGIDTRFVAKNYGLSLGCLEFDAPGVRDSACPSAEVPIPERGSATLTGCRTRNGRCGYEVDIPDVIDLGCVEVR
jgi:hypothetical protein